MPDLGTILYRPTGLIELGLMYDSGMRRFPPRLPEQPIFYPVTNPGYAAAIAREWNTRSAGGAGFVTRFRLEPQYAATFERHIVGGREHEELWIPAESLADFNAHLVGPLEVVAAFFGTAYTGFVPDRWMLKGRSATEQLVALSELVDTYPMDFQLEITANHRAVWLNFSYWLLTTFDENVVADPRRTTVLDGVRKVWSRERPPLPALFEA